jgi:mannose-6-phosphate isomerase-like protein (cupin superfamily)
MSIVRNIDEIEIQPHPFLKSIAMKVLYSLNHDKGGVTCFIVHCSVGSEIEEHIHEKETDMIFVLEGEAKMFIEDRGEVTLAPGMFVVVPEGLKHKTYDVKKELRIIDVFYPPMF